MITEHGPPLILVERGAARPTDLNRAARERRERAARERRERAARERRERTARERREYLEGVEETVKQNLGEFLEETEKNRPQTFEEFLANCSECHLPASIKSSSLRALASRQNKYEYSDKSVSANTANATYPKRLCGAKQVLEKIVVDAHYVRTNGEEISIDLRELVKNPDAYIDQKGLALDPIDALIENAENCP